MYGNFVKTISLAALAATALLTGTAHTQTVCGKRDDIILQLQTKYGETRRSLGVQRGRGVVEIFASSETGSWTILLTDPLGRTCLMAAGEAFEPESAAAADTPI